MGGESKQMWPEVVEQATAEYFWGKAGKGQGPEATWVTTFNSSCWLLQGEGVREGLCSISGKN